MVVILSLHLHVFILRNFNISSCELVNLDAKNLVHFTQNLMHNSIDLIPVSKNNVKWIENCKYSRKLKITTCLNIFQVLRISLSACNENYHLIIRRANKIFYFQFLFLYNNHRHHLKQKINVNKIFESCFSFMNFLDKLCYIQHVYNTKSVIWSKSCILDEIKFADKY